MSITIITASNTKNLELAKKFQEAFPNSTLIKLSDLNLPLFSPTTEGDKKVLDSLEDTIKTLNNSKAFIFVAPEYNGGIPPILTNFIAWTSAYSEDWRESFNSKPAALATHSGGGGIHVLSAMRLQLSYIGLNVIGRQIHTHLGKKLDLKSLESVVEELQKAIS